MGWQIYSVVFWVGLCTIPLWTALLIGEVRRRIMFGTWNS